jgi:hypothetical protein
MIRQLERLNFLHRRLPRDLRFVFTGHEQSPSCRREAPTVSNSVISFPRGPDPAVLSEAIPLFYIGQNRYGFWLPREAEGRSGGVFLCKRSALRFAQEKSAPIGCATMFVADTFELGIENEGNDLIDSMSVTIDAAARRTPNLMHFIGSMVVEWRKLVAEVSRALAGERRNRATIERELFRGQYTLSSKNDDDLPIVD